MTEQLNDAPARALMLKAIVNKHLHGLPTITSFSKSALNSQPRHHHFVFFKDMIIDLG